MFKLNFIYTLSLYSYGELKGGLKMERTYIIEFEYTDDRILSNEALEKEFKKLFPSWKKVKVREKINM